MYTDDASNVDDNWNSLILYQEADGKRLSYETSNPDLDIYEAHDYWRFRVTVSRGADYTSLDKTQLFFLDIIDPCQSITL